MITCWSAIRPPACWDAPATALDAGDLSAAVTDVATLQGAAGQAMATWLAQARALLDARAALAAWAASD